MRNLLPAHCASAQEYELAATPKADCPQRPDWAASLPMIEGRAERDELGAQLERANAEIAHLRERAVLSESLAAIGELISGVAHELNNPLTTVIGYAQLLCDSGAPDDMRADLDIISHEAKRCHRIVQNLLNLARQQKVELGPVALDEMIHRTLELKAYSLRADNIRIALELEPISPVLGNPYRIQQVLLNLVNNAHDAMVQAHGRGLLTIGCSAATIGETRLVRVSVADDGPGVAPEVRARLFEPFFTTKRERQGTGLGLPLSLQIAQEMGGNLALDADYAGGARFWLDLPVDASGGAGNWAAPLARQTRASDARILVVDDEADLAELTGRILADLGYRARCVLNGHDAVAQLADGCDLVVLDIKMPGMDGRAVYEHIQQEYPHLTRRVLLTTGDVVNAETKTWADATGCAVLEKPFTIEQLAAAVARGLIS